MSKESELYFVSIKTTKREREREREKERERERERERFLPYNKIRSNRKQSYKFLLSCQEPRSRYVANMSLTDDRLLSETDGLVQVFKADLIADILTFV